MLFQTAAAEAAQWSIHLPGQGIFQLPENGTGANQLSGIVWVSGNQYFVVSDTTHKVYPLTIEINASGAIDSATLGTGITLTPGDDLEGLAYLPMTGGFLASDEAGPAIREYSSGGALVQTLDLPAVFSHVRSNLSLESLARHPDTNAVWTANEEALSTDGPVSSFTTGTVVRLQRFDASYTPTGQWAYVTDPLPGDLGQPGRDIETSGIGDLIALAGGDLLTLERASGAGSALRSRIYQVNFNGAGDISAIPSLDGASYTTTTKSLLWSRDGIYNFEAAAVGPALPSGERSLILVSDDGSGLPQGLQALVLRQVVCGNGTIEGNETCDDSNSVGGDGCSAQCKSESCGDGTVNYNSGESCDDGNVVSEDGCSATCELETAARRCQETIIKSARGYAFDRLKALRNCRDQLNRGRALFLDAAKTQPLTNPAECVQEYETSQRIANSAAKLRQSVAAEMRARCQDSHVALLSACGQNLDSLVTDAADGGCLLTSHNAAVDQIIEDEYGRALLPTEGLERRCQDAISKAAGKYAEARWQALNACQIQLLKGRRLFGDELRQQVLTDPSQCVNEFKTARKIQRSASKVRKSLAAPGREACTDAIVANLATTCANTLDGLVTAAGDGGCLISGHNAQVDTAVAAEQ